MSMIRTRTGRGLALFGAVVASGAVAVTSASGAQSHRPTLTASTHVGGYAAMVYTQSIVLSGRETARSKPIELQADPFPFTHGFQTIAKHIAGASGKYAFRVSPTHATRYRIRLGTTGPTSSVLTVYVLAKPLAVSCNLCGGNAHPGRHTLKVRVTFELPPGPDAVTGPGYFYYAQANGSTTPTILTRRKMVPLESSHHRHTVSASYQVSFPSGAFRFAYALCVRDTEAKDGFDLPGRHHCGDAQVRSDAYLG